MVEHLISVIKKTTKKLVKQETTTTKNSITTDLYVQICYARPKYSSIVRYVLVFTSIKHPPPFKGQYFEIPYIHFDTKLTCVRQPPAFKRPFHCLLTGWLGQYCVLCKY